MVDDDVRFSTDHCWGVERDGCILVGVTPYLLTRVRGSLRCHLPEVGAKVEIAQPFGALEGTKLTFDLFAPCEGTVTRVNEAVLHDGERVRREQWDAAWLIGVQGRMPPLLSAADYSARFGSDSVWRAS